MSLSLFGGNRSLGYRPDYRRQLYKSVGHAGRTIGRWAKRQWDQRKARASKMEAKRAAPKSGNLSGYQIPIAGGDSVSKFSRYSKPNSRVVKLAKELPFNGVLNNTAIRSEVAVGLQKFVSIGDWFTSTDVGHAFTLFNGSSQSGKVVFENLHAECMITNSCNVNARLYIYDVVCRKDTDGTVTDPVTAIEGGYNDIAGGGVGDNSIVGFNPMNVPRFSEYFKVEKITPVTLSPGACHTHMIHLSPNILLSRVVTTRNNGMRGITRFTFIRYHGTPINDITTQTQVSTSAISLDIVNYEHYKVKAVVQNLAGVDINATLPGSFTVAGATMQEDGVELPFNEA